MADGLDDAGATSTSVSRYVMADGYQPKRRRMRRRELACRIDNGRYLAGMPGGFMADG